jgi:hypothetical protein
MILQLDIFKQILLKFIMTQIKVCDKYLFQQFSDSFGQRNSFEEKDKNSNILDPPEISEKELFQNTTLSLQQRTNNVPFILKPILQKSFRNNNFLIFYQPILVRKIIL